LTELVALNTGLQAGLINERLYTILVAMALVTTSLTGPVLRRLRPTSEPTKVPRQLTPVG
jgi:hypothetical protein